MKKMFAVFTTFIGVLSFVAVSIAGELIINANTSDPAMKKAWTGIKTQFEKEHPNIQVKYNIFDGESYKTAIRNWLSSSPPDVLHWFAGERLNTFVNRNLIEPISDVWNKNGLHDAMSSSKSSVTFGGKQYGLPYSYYQWGIYYRKDIFDKYGLTAPKTWNEFLKVSETLKKNGITPITIGTKYLWTAAGWFDYLNLRINGLPFHLDLMLGKISYTDPRVRKVFTTWEILVKKEYFLKNHTSYSWQEAQPFLYQGKAAMYLIGNFIVGEIPKDVLPKIDFFQFPVIDPNIPIYEDSPTDILFIPAKAKNKADAKTWLAYLSRPEVLRKLNDQSGLLSTHKKSGAKNDRFSKSGSQLLASASGLAQFYDRDTKPEMAKVGMKGFQEFMDRPERINRILKRMERTRKRAFR